MSYPSANDFKNAVKYNMIDDCPIKVEHVKVAEDIFSTDLPALKGKAAEKTPYCMEQDTMQIPREVMRSHRNRTLGIDVMCMNSFAFFIKVASKIKFAIVEYFIGKGKTMMKCISADINF